MLKKDSIFVSPVQIINYIEESIKLDKGIVPLIGSGMSASSGIPAGTDYFAYLFYCLTRVFGCDGLGNEKKVQWDPSTLRWPDYCEMPMYPDFNKAKLIWSDYIKKKINNEFKINKGNNKTIDIYFQTIGVISDWRATLNLLSRLTLGDKENGKYKIILKEPDDRVIDSFFVNLTKNKRPNSAHMIMAHISDILRIKIILTTNFDHLIESAFQQLIFPIAVFDVHLDAKLPDLDFVRAQRSLVKMHGGRYGLRADFTLDKFPSKDDVDQFINYLSYFKCKNTEPLVECQRNLLVMGVSPSSKRVISLMCFALVKLQNLQIFWLCYNSKDKKIVLEEFNKTFKELTIKGDIKKNSYTKLLKKNLKITAITDLTSFLLELYQSIFLSLPPAGVQFSSIWPFPEKPTVNWKKNSDHQIGKLTKRIKRNQKNRKFIYIYGKNGISALASKVFYDIVNEYHCLWFNIDENYSPFDFTYNIILAISRKIGYYDIIPVKYQDNNLNQFGYLLKQFNRILRYAKRRIVIFINCREMPDKKNTKLFVKSLNKLFKMFKSDKLTIVLLGYGYMPGLNNIRINKDIAERFESEKNGFENLKQEKQGNETIDIDEFYRFIFSLSLIRHTSYLSLLNSWAFIKAPYSLKSGNIMYDNDLVRYDRAKDYLEILIGKYIIRNDEKHFIYMPSVNRNKVLKLFLKHYYKDAITKKAKNEKELNVCILRAESHQGIADWYMKLFRVSGDIQAMNESIYHRFLCYKAAIKVNKSNSCQLDKDKIDKIKENRDRFLITSLIEMEQAIMLSDVIFNSSNQIITIINSIDVFIKNIKIQLKKNDEDEIFQWCQFKLNYISILLVNRQYNFLNKIGYYKLKENKPLFNSLDLNVWQKIFKEDKTVFMNIFSEIKINIHKRNYDNAENLFNNIFNKLQWDIKFEDNETEDIRKNVRTWITRILESMKEGINHPYYRAYDLAILKSQELFQFLIRLFRYYHRLKLFNAQLNRYLNIEENDNLISAEVIYICSTEMMRYVYDNDFLNLENAKIRTNTGIMLSWMKRHQEAYRRYNEAYGYLNFGNKTDTPLEYAIVDLRRGETFISKMEQKLYDYEPVYEQNKVKSPSEKELKIKFGYLYDAITSIDRGESRMSGYSNDSWWHCWMVELQMIICDKIANLRNEFKNRLKINNNEKYDLFGHCRECEYCGIRFLRNLEKGTEIVGDDNLRLARYMHLLIEFEKKINTESLFLKREFSKYKTLNKTVLGFAIKSNNLNKNINQYIKHVMTQL